MEPLVAEAIMVNADLWFGLCLLHEGDDAEKDTVLFSYLYLLSVCLTVDVMKNASIRVKANPWGILNFSCLRLYFIPYISYIPFAKSIELPQKAHSWRQEGNHSVEC